MTIDETTHQQYTERIQHGDFLPDTTPTPLPVPEEEIEQRVADYQHKCQQTLEAHSREAERLRLQIQTLEAGHKADETARAEAALLRQQVQELETQLHDQQVQSEEEKKELLAKLHDQQDETNYYRQRAEEQQRENQLLTTHSPLLTPLSSLPSLPEDEDEESAADAQTAFKAQIALLELFRQYTMDRANTEDALERHLFYEPLKSCSDAFARTFTDTDKKNAVRDAFDNIDQDYKNVARQRSKQEQATLAAATAPKVQAQTAIIQAPGSEAHIDNQTPNQKLLTNG